MDSIARQLTKFWNRVSVGGQTDSKAHTHILPLRAAGHRGADILEASEELKKPLMVK